MSNLASVGLTITTIASIEKFSDGTKNGTKDRGESARSRLKSVNHRVDRREITRVYKDTRVRAAARKVYRKNLIPLPLSNLGEDAL